MCIICMIPNSTLLVYPNYFERHLNCGPMICYTILCINLFQACINLTLLLQAMFFLFHASLHTRHSRALMTWAKVIYNIVCTHHYVKYSRWFTYSEKYFSVKQWIHTWLVLHQNKTIILTQSSWNISKRLTLTKIHAITPSALLFSLVLTTVMASYLLYQNHISFAYNVFKIGQRESFLLWTDYRVYVSYSCS